MFTRRNLFNLGLVGTASALASLPVLRAQSSSRPLRPFLDDLPVPPTAVPVNRFDDLHPAALPHAGPRTQFFNLRAELRKAKFHASLPETEIWGYCDESLGAQPWNGALGPTFKQFLAGDNQGAGTIVRHLSALPTDGEHRGFAVPHTTCHLHGAHVPYRFDGYPKKTEYPKGTEFNPVSVKGEVFDYAYPLLDPGHTSRDRFPLGMQERPSTMWYHDHYMDHTAENVYRGLVGVFLVFDELDTGDERTGLKLPSGDYDLPLVLQEKTFDLNGQLIYNPLNNDGFMGREYLVNGKVQPRLRVQRRKYRFRILNGSNARIYQLFLCDKDGRSYRLTQIATEGGLLSRPIERPSVMLGMAERIEVVIDFSKFPFPQYTELYIENRMVQEDGRGPKGTFERPELSSRGTQILKIELGPPPTDQDLSEVPSVLRPLTPIAAAEIAAAPRRRFEFDRRNGMWAINGELATETIERSIAQPRMGQGEVWRLVNKSGGWWHPIHVHHEFMRVIRRNGREPFAGGAGDIGQSLERDGLAKKDTVLLGPNSEVDVFVRFRDYEGPFVMHCHNMEHEDHAMMARFDVV